MADDARGAVDADRSSGARPAQRALYWELVSQEELSDKDSQSGSLFAGAEDARGGGTATGSCQIVHAAGDILVFESTGRRSLLRRFVVSERCWRSLPLPVVVHAAVLSPIDPRAVIILHCPAEWNSDHRYEVYALDVDTNDLEPLWVSSSTSHQLVDAGIAPKKRHGCSIAPVDRHMYLFCGLQQFPGDSTGSFVYCFSLDERMWTEVEYSGVFPAADPESPYAGCRFGQSCVVHGGKAWVFGGHVKIDGDVEPTSDFFTFDLYDHRWDAVMPLGDLRPPPMSGHAALVFGGNMLVFSGEGASQNIYSYDMALKRWELLPPIMLGPRPADGRILCCTCGGNLMSYQQCRGTPLGSVESWRHELFSIDFREVLGVLEHAGDSGPPHPRRRHELDLLGDEATADVAFLVEGRRVVAHHAILQRFAPALANVCGERSSGPVQLDDVSFVALHLMLEHIYSRFTKSLVPADAEALLELAAQFELTTLMQRCQSCIIIDASNVRHFLHLALAIRPPLEMLSKKCIEYITSHPEHLNFAKGPGLQGLVAPVDPAAPEFPPTPRHLQEPPVRAGAGAARPELLAPPWEPRLPEPLLPRGTMPATLAAEAPLYSDVGPWPQPPAGAWTQQDAVSPAPLYPQHHDARFNVFASQHQHQHQAVAAPAAVQAAAGQHAPGQPGYPPPVARHSSSWRPPHVVQPPQYWQQPPYFYAAARKMQ